MPEISRATSMIGALTPAVKLGDEPARKFRGCIIAMAQQGHMDADRIADAILGALFLHLDHDDECPMSRTAQITWLTLVDMGRTRAWLYANDERLRGEPA